MSNYHVLELNNKKDKARIAFHFAIPDENNFAGVNKRTALKQYIESQLSPGETRVVSQVPWLETGDPTEYTAIENGEIYEHMATVAFSINATDVEKRNVMDQMWTSLNSTIPGLIGERIKFWGLDRNVP